MLSFLKAVSDTHEARSRNVRCWKKNIESYVSRKVPNVPMIFRVYKTACWYELTGFTNPSGTKRRRPEPRKPTFELSYFFLFISYNLKGKYQEVAIEKGKIGETEGTHKTVVI